MGAVLYEMFKGEAPYAVLCQRKHPKWYHWDRANVEQKLDRIREYKDCMYGMAKDPRAVEQIEYPTHDQMFNDGSHQLWYIVKVNPLMTFFGVKIFSIPLKNVFQKRFPRS